MTKQWKPASYKRVREAVTELKGLIRARYPDARFRLTRDPDQRRAWFLWTYVDGEDPDKVSAVTRDRELDMLVEEHVPLHVISTADRGVFVQPPKGTEPWKWAPYPKVKAAAEDLKATIRAAYPEAAFKLARSAHQPVGWDLLVSVDVADPEDVTSLVVDRQVDLLAGEHIPIHVVVCKGMKQDRRPSSRASDGTDADGQHSALRDAV